MPITKKKEQINVTIETPEEKEAVKTIMDGYRAPSRAHAIRLAIIDRAVMFKELQKDE